MIRTAISEVDLNSNSEYVDSRDRRSGVIKRAWRSRVGSRPTFATEGQGYKANLIAWSEVVSLQSIRRIKDTEIYNSNWGRGTEYLRSRA